MKKAGNIVSKQPLEWDGAQLRRPTISAEEGDGLETESL